MVTGTTGTFSLAATLNAPFLNGAIFPVTLRVPSGKNNTEPPSLSMSRHFLSVSICERRSMRFSGTCPVRNIDQPMTGIKKLLVFEINLNGRRRWNME